MKKALLILALFSILFSCKKNENALDSTIFTTVNSPDITKYIIYLSHDTITHYDKYVNNVLSGSTAYTKSDSSVIITERNGSGATSSKKTYMLGNNGLAYLSLDSVFLNGDTAIYKYEYTYSARMLNEEKIRYWGTGSNSDTDSVSIVFNYENGNLTSTGVNSGSPFDCGNKYNYSGDKNKIDIESFLNGITGQPNMNLYSHIDWNADCPCGPSSIRPFSDFHFALNGAGYVVQKQETQSPCYRYSEQHVTRTIYTTYYEYH